MATPAAEYYSSAIYDALKEEPIIVQHLDHPEGYFRGKEVPQELACRRLGLVGTTEEGEQFAISVLYRTDTLYRVLVRKPGEPAPQNAEYLLHPFTGVANIFIRRTRPEQKGIHLVE